MKRLAQCPNVSLKVGGLGTAVFGFDFAGRPTPPSSRQLADAWRPIVEPVLDLFGAQRCMFESNFPVDRSAAGYGVVWNAFATYVVDTRRKACQNPSPALHTPYVTISPESDDTAACLAGPCGRVELERPGFR